MWEDAGSKLSEAATQVEAAGADFLVICTNTMHKVAPQIEETIRIPLLHIVDATAAVIKEKGLTDSAAIAGKQAADLYKMDILFENIEDIDQNFTRFFVFSKERSILENANKTSIVFSVENVPGSLYNCLGFFASKGIGFSKIESRPLHGKPWEYLFYLDIEESIQSLKCNEAIEKLKSITEFVKILGCYRNNLGE